MRTKKAGNRGPKNLYADLGAALQELEQAEARVLEICEAYGIDFGPARTSPAKKPKVRKGKKAKKAAPGRRKRAGLEDSLRVLKIRGRSIGAVMDAGYETFAKLNGASRSKLVTLRGVGENLVDRLERELSKRGGTLKA